MLASGSTAVEVAHKLGMRAETLTRWKKLPEFQKRFEQVAEELQHDMHHRLNGLVDASISRLKSELGTIYSDPKRIQTALNVLKLLGTGRITPQTGPNRLENDP